MAMSVSDVIEKAGEHPYVTGAVVFVGGLGLLYLFGFFGGNSGGGQTSGAAAFYNAEAAQAAIGGQVQIATLQTAAATAQAGLASKTSLGLASIQANAAKIINQQNATSAGHLADLQATTAMHLGDVSAAEATAIAQINGTTALGVAATSAGRDIGVAQTQAAQVLGVAGIQGDVAKHTVDTQYLATVSNNATALQTAQINTAAATAQAQIAEAASAAHDAALIQQQQQQLASARQSQLDANMFNFIESANTGFRTLIPASGTG